MWVQGYLQSRKYAIDAPGFSPNVRSDGVWHLAAKATHLL